MPQRRGSWIKTVAIWIKAVVIGIIACLLTVALLSVAAMVLSPELADDQSAVSHIYGVAIWLVAIGVGVSQVARYRPQR